MPLSPKRLRAEWAMGRALRAALTPLLALLLVTCTDNPVSPGRPGIGTLRLIPTFNEYAQFAPLVLDSVRVIIVRPPTDTLRPIIGRHFNANSQQLQLDIPVTLQNATEDLEVTLEMYAGSLLLFSGTDTVQVSVGGNATAQPASLTYSGPGKSTAALNLTPRDTTVALGGGFTFGVTAIDSQAAPVTTFYVGWGATAGTVDATGRFTAPSSRDTVTVRATTPTGIKDSTRVFVVATPSALAVAGGNGQTAQAGTRLSAPLAVRVDGNDGLPLPGVTVSFAATTGGGSVDSATATTDASGVARTGATLGSLIGDQTFTASRTGLTTVTFTEHATSTSNTFTWTGATSTNWSTATNWDQGQVPNSANDVVIPFTGITNFPQITTSCSAQTLTVDTNATLNLGTFNCTVSGNVFADGIITGTGTAAVAINTTAQIRGNFPSLQLSGPVTASDPVLATGTLIITGTSGSFTVNGQSVGIGGNLQVQGGALLIMTNPADVVTVSGNALFTGGNELGNMSAGALSIGGNLAQASGTTGDTFHPSGTHLTLLIGNNPTVTFQTPGDVPGTSHFQQLAWAGTGTLTLATNVFAHSLFTTTSTTPVTISGSGTRTFQIGSQAGAGHVTFNNVQLVLKEEPGEPLALSNVTFQGLPTTVTQLAVNHSGLGGPFTFDNLTFSVTPTTGGFYISATDANPSDGTPLTIDITNSSPAAGAPFIQTTNGAVVNWTTGPPAPTWDGSASSDWNDPANWSTNLVPGSSDSVVIPNVPTQPVLPADVTVGAVNVTGGDIGLNGHTLNVARTFATTGIGTLTMTNPSDTVNVGGDAIFAGAAGGVLTDGVLQIGGNFTQLATTSAASFAASAAHVTRFTRAVPTPPIISFQTPGPNASHFGILAHANCCSSAGFTLASDVTALGSLEGSDGFGGTINGTCGKVLTIQTVFGITLDCVQLAIDDPSATYNGLGSVTFLNQPTNADQLTIRHPGFAAGAYTLDNITWFPLSTGTGAYVNAQDADAQNPPLTVNVLGNDPGNGPSFTKNSGGAVVNWLAASHVWNGITNDWFQSFNWSTNTVPTATDDVIIPATGTAPNVGVGASSAVAQNLTLQPGASLTLSDAPLAVSGNVNVGSGASISDVGVGVLNLTGASKTMVGDVGAFTLPSGSSYTLGGLTTSAGNVNVNGSLALGGFSLIVAGDFVTNGTGTLAMASMQDALSVGGNAVFGGGTSSLTAGSILVGGNFTQQGATTSFAAAAAHTVSMAGATAQTVSFANPGLAASHFGNLVVSSAGGVTLLGDVTALGTVTVGSGTLKLNGNHLGVVESFGTSGLGTLTMQSPSDSLVVSGPVVFAGGSTAGLLTLGVISAGGNFVEAGSLSTTSFAATGTIVILEGAGSQFVSFTNPGATASHFYNIGIANTAAGGGVALGSDVYVLGGIGIAPTAVRTIHGTGGTLHLATLNINDPLGATFDNVLLDFDVALGGAFTAMSNVSFQNYSTAATVLRFRHPGSALAPISLSNVRFLTTIGAGTGFYVAAIDSDGAATATLNLLITSNGSPGPSEGPAHVSLSGGATVSFQN